MHRTGKFYESEYEKAVVQMLQDEGWLYYHGEEVPNRRVDEALIEDDLRNFITAKYADKDLTTDEVDTIVARLRNSSGSTEYEALYNTVALYRDGFDFVYPDGRAASFHLDFLDFETPKNGAAA